MLGLQRLERIFPALRTTVYSVVAEPDEKYNCIARAAGVVHDWWDPIDETRYWPPSARRGDTVEIVMEGLSSAGYERCADGAPDPAVEKTVLNEYEGEFTHVAKRLPSGLWSSKRGRERLIEHDLDVLTNQANISGLRRCGEVVALMREARAG